MTLGRRTALAAALLGAALAAWIAAAQRMRGMDAGPGTDLGALGWFLGVWVTMMAAMMLPSAAPALDLVERLRGLSASLLFVLGYLVAWTAFGLAAYAVYRGLRAAGPSFLGWDEHGPLVAGGALAAAGLYQLSPFKDACLRHCRSPLHVLVRGRSDLRGDGVHRFPARLLDDQRRAGRRARQAARRGRARARSRGCALRPADGSRAVARLSPQLR